MKLFEKYKHFFIVPVFFVFYMAVFHYVENRTGLQIHMLHSHLDTYIPFCEYFIIPYILWFFYIAFAVIYFGLINKNRSEYYRLITSLGFGMTLFLIISLVFPNGHNLRPHYFERNNLFVRMVQYLYRIDTSTNVLPSIHVFNSVVVAIAVADSSSFKNRLWIVRCSNLLAFLIVCSTVFLKQHTLIDVIAALLLNIICFLFIYFPKYLSNRKPIFQTL